MATTKKQPRGNSLTVREWLRLYTDQAPPLSAKFLDRPVNEVGRRALRPAAQWLVSLGIDG